jgi:hypothetical protein
LGFHPAALVDKNCTQIENKQIYTGGETIHKTMQKHRTQQKWKENIRNETRNIKRNN